MGKLNSRTGCLRMEVDTTRIVDSAGGHMGCHPTLGLRTFQGRDLDSQPWTVSSFPRLAECRALQPIMELGTS